MLYKALLISAFFALIGCGATSPTSTGLSDAKSTNDADTKVRNAIIRAGHQQGWRMKLVKQGQIHATIYKRGFMASTEIVYSPESYTIKFKDTSNKSYYTDWVDRLDDEIQTQLDKS